jgi:hypothetical protein
MPKPAAPGQQGGDMGMWIELGVFLLVFVFAWHQLRDLKKERAKRQAQSDAAKANPGDPPPDQPGNPH